MAQPQKKVGIVCATGFSISAMMKDVPLGLRVFGCHLIVNKFVAALVIHWYKFNIWQNKNLTLRPAMTQSSLNTWLVWLESFLGIRGTCWHLYMNLPYFYTSNLQITVTFQWFVDVTTMVRCLIELMFFIHISNS